MNQETIGRYFCKATVNGFPEIGEQATVYLKGPPAITSTKRQFGIPGDTSRIECIAFSIPKARHVSWTYNGMSINSSSDENFSVLEDPLPYGIKSTLVIRESGTKHFGRYNCTVINDYGYDVLEIELNGESRCKFLLMNPPFSVTSFSPRILFQIILSSFSSVLVLQFPSFS